MLSVACRRMGAAVRGGLATRGGAAATRTYCVTPAEAGNARIADVWLLSEFTRRQSSSMKELAALRAESTMIAKEFNAALAKRRDRKTKRAAEMVEWAVLAVGTVGIFGMHLHLLYEYTK